MVCWLVIWAMEMIWWLFLMLVKFLVLCQWISLHKPTRISLYYVFLPCIHYILLMCLWRLLNLTSHFGFGLIWKWLVPIWDLEKSQGIPMRLSRPFQILKDILLPSPQILIPQGTGEDSFCFRFTKWRLMDRKHWSWLVCLSIKSVP